MTIEPLAAMMFGAIISLFLIYISVVLFNVYAWSKSTATVIARRNIQNGENANFKYILSYYIDGIAYTETALYDMNLTGGALEIGDRTKILYNPAKPREIAIIDYDNFMYAALIRAIRFTRNIER